MSKAKKPSLSGTDTNETFTYKPKDLVWSKMKGYPPWPAMICEPTVDLLNQPRKTSARCCYFFGTRNFAWIELNNLKPFEGPWKDDLTKGNKQTVSFKQALADINAYILDPTEVDEDVKDKTGVNHVTDADFDKLKDGTIDEQTQPAQSTQDSEQTQAESTMATTTPVPDGFDNGEIEDESTTNDIGDGPGTAPKASGKRTPKAKASAALSVKGNKTPTLDGPTTSKAATKRRRSSQTGNSTSNKRKRNTSVSGGATENVDSEIHDMSASLTTPKGASSITRRNVNALALLNRPVVPRPETQVIDMSRRSQTLADRDIEPSSLIFGFLGLGIMGSTIVKDLIYTGHRVVVWNRTKAKCLPFREAGAVVKDTPFDVVDAADIIFCCVSDPKGSKELVFGNCGVLRHADLRNKAYVEMSTIDPETSQDIAEGITQCNGRYLEAQIHGTRQEAEDGMLIIVAGGDRTVFEECHSCFKTIAKNTFFLGEVGNACKVNLILQTIVGVSLVGLAEALALADRFSISLKDIVDIFELTSMKSPLLLAKGKEMAKGEFNPQQPLSHMQKDLRLVLNMAENLDQAMPVTATTNEVFKHTKRLGYGEHDSSAVFVRSRF